MRIPRLLRTFGKRQERRDERMAETFGAEFSIIRPGGDLGPYYAPTRPLALKDFPYLELEGTDDGGDPINVHELGPAVFDPLPEGCPLRTGDFIRFNETRYRVEAVQPVPYDSIHSYRYALIFLNPKVR